MGDIIKKVVGNPDLKRVARDSDRDGVMNIIDCKPHDPNKQGVIHKIGAAIARKAGREEAAERIEERGRQRDEERREYRETERAAYREERIKVARQRGIERAKARPLQSFGAFLGDISKHRPPQFKRVVGKRKGKKGKKKKGAAKRTVVQPQQQRPSMLDFKF